MLIDDIFEAINQHEEWEWESEAPFHHYEIEYDVEANRIEIFFIEEYHFDGDNWGEIDTKIIKTKVFFAEYISAEKYINLLISMFNNRRELEHLYGTSPNKIRFVRV